MNKIPFTFYGDLLGVGAAYRLSAKTAYDKLNSFYNETFHTLDALCTSESTEVQMFSDSLFVAGDDAIEALGDLGLLYSNLLRKGLMLRGAIVKGRLTYDARVTKPNFQKSLPSDDTLARAAGLEKSELGARFLIEPTLADTLLDSVPAWKTHEGYIGAVGAINDARLQKICPTPSNEAFEYLYYWSEDVQDSEYTHCIKALKNILPMIDGKAKEHYKATIDLVSRCQHRNRITKQQLEQGS